MGPAASGHTGFLPDGSQRRLAADCVATGFAASGAVPKTIGAETDVQLALTEHAVLFALAAFFDLLALAATNFGFGGGHGETLSLVQKVGKVPLVTTGCGYELRFQTPRSRFEMELRVPGDLRT